MLDPNNTRIGYNPGDDGEFTPEDQVVRPAHSTAKTSKDFKKILGKNPRENQDEDEFASGEPKKVPGKAFSVDESPQGFVAGAADKDDQENASSQGGAVSLFDLSSGASKQAQQAKKAQPPLSPTAKVESPAEMFKHMSAREVDKTEKAGALARAERQQPVTEEPTQTKFTTRYAQEQPDLSSVNPLATAVGMAQPTGASSSDVKPVAPVDQTKLIALVNEIVKHMYTVRTEGRTDTVIVLQHPPLFKDAQIIVSAFDSARGQFNISFENLTQAAQAVLSLEANKKALVDALQEKGYGVQIYNATTLAETAPQIDESAFRGNREREQEQPQDEQQQQQRKRQPGNEA